MALRIPRFRINRLWLVLGGAIVMGLLAAWLSVGYLKNKEAAMADELAEKAKGGPTTSVAVATMDVAKGSVLTGAVVAARDVPTDLLYDDVITAEGFAEVQGKTLIRSLLPGRPLRMSDVIDDRPRDIATELTPGHRALTFDIDEINSFAQMLRAGSHVDLYLIAQNPNSASDGQEIRPLLPKVKVLATGQTLQGEGQLQAAHGEAQRPVNYSNITVDVTPEQAVRIALATQVGKIRAVLRKPEDASNTQMAQLSTPELFQSGKKGGGKGVSYIVGGTSSNGTAPPITVNIPNLPGMPAGAGAAPGSVAPGAVGTQPGIAGAPGFVNSSIPVAQTGMAR